MAEENIILDPGNRVRQDGPTHPRDHAPARPSSATWGVPCSIGASRKSTIGYVLDLPVHDRVEGTAASVAVSIANGADIVRVHDVKQMVRVARMTDAIVRGWKPG